MLIRCDLLGYSKQYMACRSLFLSLFTCTCTPPDIRTKTQTQTLWGPITTRLMSCKPHAQHNAAGENNLGP